MACSQPSRDWLLAAFSPRAALLDGTALQMVASVSSSFRCPPPPLLRSAASIIVSPFLSSSFPVSSQDRPQRAFCRQGVRVLQILDAGRSPARQPHVEVSGQAGFEHSRVLSRSGDMLSPLSPDADPDGCRAACAPAARARRSSSQGVVLLFLSVSHHSYLGPHRLLRRWLPATTRERSTAPPPVRHRPANAQPRLHPHEPIGGARSQCIQRLGSRLRPAATDLPCRPASDPPPAPWRRACWCPGGCPQQQQAVSRAGGAYADDAVLRCLRRAGARGGRNPEQQQRERRAGGWSAGC